MKIDLQAIDRESFHVNEHVLNGERVYLVIPKNMGVKWTAENKIFRSSLWNWNGELISAGFKKFSNWGENPEVFPLPKTLEGAVITEKIDGSLIIISKYNGHLIVRTRGTVDATALENGYELNDQAFKSIVHSLENHSDFNWSYLFEWVSPTQRIILNYGDRPDWYLVGAVHHNNYRLLSQHGLDILADSLHFKRPQHYEFPSISSMISAVEEWKDREGVCVYSNGGQSIHKIKSFSYLAKHRFKSEATLENTLELYFSMGKPTYLEFERRLIEMFDYECFSMVRGYASSICDASKEVSQIILGIKTFVEPLKLLPRKDAAKSILSSYGNSGRSNMAFTMLDGKELSADQIKKIFWQVLKK